MDNTFNQLHIEAINRALKGSEVVCKRSKVFTNAVVIGTPGKSGSLIVSLDFETTNHPGRGVWLTHYSKDMDPKSMSDGNVDFIQTEEEQFLYWRDLVNHIKSIFC